MPRISRMIVRDEDAVYHVISKTVLDGYVMGDVEKEYLLGLIRGLSSVYLVEVFGFCIMGNHFHLLVRMKEHGSYSDEEIKGRLEAYYKNRDDNRVITDGQIPYLRRKLSNLSEYVKELKQRFARYYNKRHGREGFFWNGRFKSVIVEDGDALVNCLAYIDLNPVRANIVERPEDYRWSSIGYHIQSGNEGGLLNTDYGIPEFGDMIEGERLRRYREYLYENGEIERENGKAIEGSVLAEERKRGFELKPVDRLRYRTRYFTDSGIIGTKEFVSTQYLRFKDYFKSKHEKKPKRIIGFDGMYSLKRLFNE